MRVVDFSIIIVVYFGLLYEAEFDGFDMFWGKIS